ncbi:hypothetical protein O181_101971 [Austropuccinia psidii MF-1]|uniref:Integrase catalytic domain-containing protein n=1 Tax=Austropuccinia psidii MF-1 TaxID=1389203 RepID=A0A9Q3JHS7_9BASI|nr:hypothetical protein [Austropuccinia psidii MF-1]
MDWIIALPPGGEKSYNACLLILDRYSKTPIFLTFHKDDTAMDNLLIWNRVISHTGLFKSIIIDRDPRFTSALWKNLHKLLGTKLSFLTAYHHQTDGLSERSIQTLDDMIGRFCAYGLELKYSDGFAMIGVHLYQHWNWPRRLLSILQQAKFLQCWKRDGTLNFQLTL